jgi:hypothetical protein
MNKNGHRLAFLIVESEPGQACPRAAPARIRQAQRRAALSVQRVLDQPCGSMAGRMGKWLVRQRRRIYQLR